MDELDDNDDGDDAYEFAGKLNPYLFSDDPRLNDAANHLYGVVTFQGQKKLILNQIKILLLNLIHLKKTKPQGSLRYSRRNQYWTDFSKAMPNPWGITAKIDHVIDQMAEAGLLRIAAGIIKNKVKRQTRIQPTAKLTAEYLKPFDLLGLPLGLHKEFPLLQVHIKRKSEVIKDHTDHIRYEAKGTAQTKRMKEQLKSYNTYISKQAVTLANTPETQHALEHIDFDLKSRCYRVFSDRELTSGGRFYGPWWQSLSSDLRKHITINGQATIELDYKSQHACMLYGFCLNKPMSAVLGDSVDAYTFGGYPRDLGKAMFTIALNTRRKNSREALRNNLIKKMNNKDDVARSKIQSCLHVVNDDDLFAAFLSAFEDHHKALLDPDRYLYPHSNETKWWRQFQCHDSQICAYVLQETRLRGIPCISIHDSFIVTQDKEDELRAIMTDAYTKADYIPDLSSCIPEVA